MSGIDIRNGGSDAPLKSELIIIFVKDPVLPITKPLELILPDAVICFTPIMFWLFKFKSWVAVWFPKLSPLACAAAKEADVNFPPSILSSEKEPVPLALTLPEVVTLAVIVLASVPSWLCIAIPLVLNFIEPSVELPSLNSIVSPAVIIWSNEPVTDCIPTPDDTLELIIPEDVMLPIKVWVSVESLPNKFEPLVTITDDVAVDDYSDCVGREDVESLGDIGMDVY